MGGLRSPTRREGRREAVDGNAIGRSDQRSGIACARGSQVCPPGDALHIENSCRARFESDGREEHHGNPAAGRRIPMMLFPSITFESRATRIFDVKRVARWTNLAAARACNPRALVTSTDCVTIYGFSPAFSPRRRSEATH